MCVEECGLCPQEDPSSDLKDLIAGQALQARGTGKLAGDELNPSNRVKKIPGSTGLGRAGLKLSPTSNSSLTNIELAECHT